MDPSQFGSKSPGKMVPITLHERKLKAGITELAEVKAYGYVPNPLPPKLDWSRLKSELFDLYQEATLALGRVNGLHKRVGKGATLLRTLWMREAKLSSEVEGIETTAEDMVLAGAGRDMGARGAAIEGWNYVHALERGIQSELPLCNRLICEMHALLMTGARGEEKRPGEFRDSAVFIGNPEDGPKKARFIPPPPGGVLRKCMSDFESFVHSNPPQIPSLFCIALAHYQFETLHPFRDGNGRIGRVMMSRSLVKEGLLDHPAVYMSAYINEHKQAYVDRLLRVSTNGEWGTWIEFVLRAIETQANDSIARSELLIGLREEYHSRLRENGHPTRLFGLVDRLFEMPALNAAEAESITGQSSPTAYSDLQKLENCRIIREYTGKKRGKDWVAPGIIEIIQADKATDLALENL